MIFVPTIAFGMKKDPDGSYRKKKEIPDLIGRFLQKFGPHLFLWRSIKKYSISFLLFL
jgi:hypothetical protein